MHTDIVKRLRYLSEQMIQLGADMDYYSGFNAEIAEKGRQLVGAGMIADGWADEIVKSSQSTTNPHHNCENT